MRDVKEVLKSTWGYDRFRPNQEEVVRRVMAGEDVLALLPTGGGKSLCFQVPALAMGRMCLVVSPLIALMKDQVARLREKGIRAVAITSGADHHEIDVALENAANGHVPFLYVSPERLGTELFMARLSRLPIGFIAVDEAHCISQWGYDFRPSYLRISALREARPELPIVALTASATPAVASDIMERLALRGRQVVRGSFARPELTFWISRGEDKMGRLLRITERVPGCGIVYVRERKGTLRVARFLEQHGISALPYHAGMSMEERDEVQRKWSRGEVRYVAATTAFGMGIDKGDVRSVVHLEPPPDLESYYQEAGRAGRDAQASYAFLLVHDPDELKLRERLAASFPELVSVRRVYQAFADTHRIALGSGEFETYPFDLRDLASRSGLAPVVVMNCLKALELDGALSLNESARTPSRVGMRSDHRVVYDIRVRDARQGPLLEALLRMHGGLFEEPVIIDEERIAQHLKWSVDQVIAGLQELHHKEVLFYRKRSDSPMITLLTPRKDAQRLSLDPQALAARKQRAETRLEALIAFCSPDTRCREQALLAYFGEGSAKICGRCDACRASAAKGGTSMTISIARSVQEIEEERWSLDVGPASGKAPKA